MGLTRDEGKDGLSFLCLLKQALVDQKWQGCLEPECLHGEVIPCPEDRVFPTEAKLAWSSLGRRSGQQRVDSWLEPAFLRCYPGPVDSPLQPLQGNTSRILDSISQTLESLRIGVQKDNLGPPKWPRGTLLLLQHTMVPGLGVI